VCEGVCGHHRSTPACHLEVTANRSFDAAARFFAGAGPYSAGARKARRAGISAPARGTIAGRRWPRFTVTDDREDRRFGRYQVIEKLGAGAMGAVYRARDEALGRDVAVKTIRSPGLEGFRAEMFHARFEHEARAVAALSHPHVVNIFDVGVEGKIPFLVMELVPGESLADRLERGPLAIEEARGLGAQIAAALEAAHALGIVHRDVKPGNVLAAGPGAWKLADFGVAHVPDSALTITGQFLGSPAYSAPEALGRGEFGPPSDVYGLGATLYQALSGQLPFGERGRMSPGALASGAAAPALGDIAAVPADLGAAVMSALDPDPARRPSAAALARAFGGDPAQAVRLPAPASGSSRLLPIVAIVVVLVVGIGIGAGVSSDDDAPAGPPRPEAAFPVDHPGHDDGPPGFGDERGPPDFARDEKWARKQEKRWRKVRDKLEKGDYGEAREKLEEILREDPDDLQARRLYDQLEPAPWDDDDDDD
jgi:tRNA A-37 threonylcarbamoyl transferase component Bud32